MSNPAYRLRIDLTLARALKEREVELTRIGYVPFAPRDGDTLRLTDDNDETMDITLDGVVYDVHLGQFHAANEDTSLRDAHYEGDDYNEAELIAFYQQFDFQKLGK